MATVVGGATAAAIVFVLALGLWFPGSDNAVTNPIDFRAFRCAGIALSEARNPYRVEPMRSCQRAALRVAGLKLDERHVLPAPLPPYALAPFALFGALSVHTANAVWLTLGIFAVVSVVFGLRLLTGVPLLPLALASASALGLASLPDGQLPPFIVAALVWAALAARRRWYAAAALALVIAALEPHLALPAWIGVAFAVPGMRKPLAAASLILVALSLAFGEQLNQEYFFTVLASHARSEVMNFPAQYSLSSLLWRVGTPIAAALWAGSASYAVMLVVGVAAGAALVRRTGDAAFAIVVPAAFAVLGGPFIHGHQMAVALPLAFLLLARTSTGSSARWLLMVAVISLAIPWQSIAESSIFADRRASRSWAAAVPHLPVARARDELEISYTAFVDAFANRVDRRSVGEQFVWKLPTWCALIVLAAFALAACSPRAGAPPHRR